MTSEDHLIERGLRAQELMSHDAFHDLFDTIVSEIGREILATDLDDPLKHREQLYLTVHGMRAFTNRLASYVSQMKSIEDERNAKLDEQDED